MLTSAMAQSDLAAVDRTYRTLLAVAPTLEEARATLGVEVQIPRVVRSAMLEMHGARAENLLTRLDGPKTAGSQAQA